VKFDTRVKRLIKAAILSVLSGLYLRYNLLVAYLLDRKRISVHEMLSHDFDRASLEAEMLAENHGS
jgi:hypothetical protein